MDEATQRHELETFNGGEATTVLVGIAHPGSNRAVRFGSGDTGCFMVSLMNMHDEEIAIVGPFASREAAEAYADKTGLRRNGWALEDFEELRDQIARAIKSGMH